MKTRILILIALCLLSNYIFSQGNIIQFEKCESFFPDEKKINQQSIEWGYLTVPENWNKPNDKTIKIAVAILKSESDRKDANPILYIPGGPGGGSIDGIEKWIDHPLRKNSDIILFDPRGTGNSIPRFCPVLGRAFLEILAKNQNSIESEKQKASVAMECRQELITQEIDLSSYNSKAIAKDLNALKNALHYKSWDIYGVSYGTYIAQVYANDFPLDIKSIILDSAIADISEYYNQNTSNYMASLSRVFNECLADPNCNKEYPELENTYYKTISELTSRPITVKVSKKIISTGTFTYNAEDFKIAIQQSLYDKNLIEVLPLLISEFHKRNVNTLSSLVESFSRALSLDYGAYYCVTCNEILPFNSLLKFNSDADSYKRLKGGLSFYKSDFLVCDKWNSNEVIPSKQKNDLSNLSKLNSPVLIFSGLYDPITPFSNGQMMQEKFKNAKLITAPVFGHAPSFSEIGKNIVVKFEKQQAIGTVENEFSVNKKVKFARNINVNAAMANFAKSAGELNVFIATPFVISLLLIIWSLFYRIHLLINRNYKNKTELYLSIILNITSLFGLFFIIGLITVLDITIKENYYILAFGVSNKFKDLFFVQWVFLFLTFLSLFYFIIKIRSISNPTLVFIVLFAFMVFNFYFTYWGFFMFKIR